MVNSPHEGKDITMVDSPHEGKDITMVDSPHEGKDITMVDSPHEGKDITMVDSPHEGKDITMVDSPHEGKDITMVDSPHEGKDITMVDSPHEGKERDHMSRSPTKECQNSTHPICWRISKKESINPMFLAHHVMQRLLTFSLRASGAVHLTGSFVPSDFENTSRARPKSDTFATLSSDISTFRAAKSLQDHQLNITLKQKTEEVIGYLCTNFCDSR